MATWRRYRDFFYDEDIQQVDWGAMRRQYGDMLAGAVTRWDVNVVIGELIGETSAGHTYVNGGDTESTRSRPVGLLSMDWSLENGAFRIARIVEGAPWDSEVRSPFKQPGVSVAAGEYILAVNAVPIDMSKDPYAAFAGLARETVAVTINGATPIVGLKEKPAVGPFTQTDPTQASVLQSATVSQAPPLPQAMQSPPPQSSSVSSPLRTMSVHEAAEQNPPLQTPLVQSPATAHMSPAPQGPHPRSAPLP